MDTYVAQPRLSVYLFFQMLLLPPLSYLLPSKTPTHSSSPHAHTSSHGSSAAQSLATLEPHGVTGVARDAAGRMPAESRAHVRGAGCCYLHGHGRIEAQDSRAQAAGCGHGAAELERAASAGQRSSRGGQG